MKFYLILREVINVYTIIYNVRNYLQQEAVPVLAEDVFSILADKQSIEILTAASTGLRETPTIFRISSTNKIQ